MKENLDSKHLCIKGQIPNTVIVPPQGNADPTSRFIQELLVLVLAVVEHPEQPPSGGSTHIHTETGLFSNHLPGWIQFKAPKQGVKMTLFFD